MKAVQYIAPIRAGTRSSYLPSLSTSIDVILPE